MNTAALLADKNQINIILITTSVFIGFLVTPFSISGVNVVIPAIQEELHLSLLAANWIPTMFMLSNTAMILPAGRLADNYGRKRMYMLGTVIVIVGSIICVLSTNFYYLLSGRFIQGLGGSFIFSSGFALIVSAVPKEKRGVYIGIVSACVYIGLSTGPLFGGWLGENYGWRSTFFTLIPLSCIILIILMFTKGKDWRSDVSLKLDVTGSVLLAAAMTSLVVAVTFISHPYSTLGFIISIGSSVLFFTVQKRKTNSLIPINTLRQNRPLLRGVIRAALMYSGNFPIMLLIALYMQYVFHLNAIEAGIALFWQAAAMTLSAILSGKCAQRFTIRKTAVSGTVIFIIGLLVLLFATGIKHLVIIQVGLFIMGFGFGLFSPSNNTMSLRDVTDNKMGIASGLISFARVSGNIFGSVVVILLTVVTVGSGVSITMDNVDDFVLLTQAMVATTTILAIYSYYITKHSSRSTPD